MSLAVTVATPSEVQLSWTPHPDSAAVYDIYRNGIAAYPYHVSGTSFTDSGLQPSTKYCYVIRAVVWPIGTVGTSNQVCIKTQDTAGWAIEVVGSGRYLSLAIDNTNTAHISYRRSDGIFYAMNATGSWVEALVDGAASWSGPTSIAVDSIGSVHMSYRNGMDGKLYYASNASGVWDSTSVDSSGGWANALALDPADKVHISYSSGSTTSDLMYATNVGGAWQATFIAGYHDSIQQTDIGFDPAGVVHIAYAVGSGICAIRYANNVGGVWSDVLIDESAACGVALDLDSNGHPHLAYMRGNQLVHAANASGAWSNSIIDTLYWIGGSDVSVAVDSADKIHISYQDHNADLKYATDTSGMWQMYYIDSTGEIGSDSALRVDPNGRIYIAYTDETLGAIKLATSP